MENVWQYLPTNKLFRCAWNDYNAILQACAEAWNWFIADPNRIRSVGAREWATALSRLVEHARLRVLPARFRDRFGRQRGFGPLDRLLQFCSATFYWDAPDEVYVRQPSEAPRHWRPDKIQNQA